MGRVSSRPCSLLPVWALDLVFQLPQKAGLLAEAAREAARRLGICHEARIDPPVRGAFRIGLEGRVPSARVDTCHEFQNVVERPRERDVEPTSSDGLNHVGPQHQVGKVALGNDDSLSPRQPARRAGVEEPLDLGGCVADRLDVELLVD